jgi:lipid A oxidase
MNEAPLRGPSGGIGTMVRVLFAGLVAERTHPYRIVMAGLLAVAFGASPAAAESQLGVYGGWNGSFDSDIHLIQPNGTNMTPKDVPWDGDSFGAPPYWGLRGTYWFDSTESGWGVMFDYNHAKVIADQGAVVDVLGTRDGFKLGPTDRVGDTFQVMEFTDGLNQFYLGGEYRWMHERWTPYAGFGVGASVPDVEVRRVGVGQPYTFEYASYRFGAMPDPYQPDK